MFLSIIIPVYNTEEYLDECLMSMLEQQDIPLAEYELVCVNDGSTDGSLAILERYAEKYPNVIVIDQENGGVCVARNVGLGAARGDYVWFVDADDLIQANILGSVQEKLAHSTIERLIIGSCLFYELPSMDAAGRYSIEGLKTNTSWENSVVWRNIFRRSYLQRHSLCYYPGLVYGEDALFMYEVRRYDPVCQKVDEPLYFHRERAGSASTASAAEFDKKRLISNLREARIMQKYYESGDGVLAEVTANRLMIFLWGALYRMAQLPNNEAAPLLKELKKCGLFPYRRPEACTVTRSFEVDQDRLIGKLFDKIYLNLHTRWGYVAMRLWFAMGRLKRKLRG